MSARDKFGISEEAALWLIRLGQEGTPDCRQQFTAWARQSPLHVEEFLFAQATLRHLNGVDAGRRIDLGALEDGDDADNVIALEESLLSRNYKPRCARLHPSRRTVLAASLVVATGLWAFLSWFPNGAPVYTTAVGDQQAVKLQDGSVMHLNTGSRAEVRFTGQVREVRLLAGEALFVVEHDPLRPFRVMTATASIQALGTQFNVYRLPGATRVSVIEGAVRVSPATGTDSYALRLAAGDEAEGAGGRIVRTAKPDVQRAVAWRDRRLVFQADPLEEVVREFNRYEGKRPIRLDGEGLRRRAISGVFDADDPQPLVEFLEQDPGLSVTRGAREIVIRAQ